MDQPYSWGMQNYWSDGSLRYAGFMLRCGAAIAGSGTLAVSVRPGGSCPAPSARTLTEVYAQNLVVTGVGLGAGPAYGLGGTWQSWLNGDANQPEAYVYMDGAAGKVWRCLSHFAESEGGTPHGTLECYHYIAGLTDASGNLGGFRYLGRICQPWYNLDPMNGSSGAPANDWAASTAYSSGAGIIPLSGNLNWMIFEATTGGTSGASEPAWPQTVGATVSDGTVTWKAIAPAKNWRAFSSINYQTVGPGGTGTATVDLTWPFTSAAFTWTSANNYATTAANNFYCGSANYQNDGNLIPCYLTTTGALPTGLNTGQIYWLLTNSIGGDTFVLYDDSSAGNAPGGHAANATAAGSGTNTIVPVPVCLPFFSLWTADQNGKWQFFQGTGSLAADNTVRTQADVAYLHKTRLILPFDITNYTGAAFGGTIADNSFAYTWNPFSMGPLAEGARGHTGGDPDIGPLTVYHARCYYNQSAVSELVARCIAFSNDFDCNNCFRDAATRQLLNLSANTYAGIPAPTTTQQNLGYFTGKGQYFTLSPNVNANYYLLQEQTNSHKPSKAYYAALMHGEPQFVDMTLEAGNGAVIETYWPYRNTGAPFPVATGLVNGGAGSGGMRTSAWSNRDVQYAAMLAPANHSDGSQIGNYFNDLADANANYPYQVMQNAATLLNSYCAANGLLVFPFNPNAPGIWDPTCGSSFMMCYYLHVLCFSAARGNTSAQSVLTTLSKWYAHVLSTWGGWLLYPEYCHAVALDSGDNPTSTLIASDSHYGVCSFGNCISTLSWTAGPSPAFTANGIVSGFYISNGDQWLFDASIPIPGGFSAETPYYAVNVSGAAFDLAAAKGGRPIIPTSAGSVAIGSGSGQGYSGPFYAPSNPPAASTGQTPTNYVHEDTEYVVEWLAAFHWMQAINPSDPNLSALVNDAATRVAAYNTDLTESPIWTMQSSY
ncbi:MAG: hypothetical protein ACREE4_11825 [Stellaceae bacterium]